VPELRRIRDAVRRAKVRTIVSFELHYNPYLRFARWLRESGWLGDLRFARFQYLSRVTDWYPAGAGCGPAGAGAATCWRPGATRSTRCAGAPDWSGRSVRLPHAVHHGYEYPTSIVVNLKMGRSARKPVLGQVVSSTDFQMPYAFGVEMMGAQATLRHDLILWNDEPVDLAALRRACPVAASSFARTARPPVRQPSVITEMPGSADVSHHPFQGEIDELVACILERRETHLNVHDAQKTMEICLAADRSAERDGRPVACR
jgi:predicted dehydrogenase